MIVSVSFQAEMSNSIWFSLLNVKIYCFPLSFLTVNKECFVLDCWSDKINVKTSLWAQL